MVEYAEKRLPEFRSAYDKLTRCAKELTLVYDDIYASVVRDPKRFVLQFIFVINALLLFLFCRLYRTLLMRLKTLTLLQRIEEIIFFNASKEEDIVEDVKPGFPRKKKLKEEVKTTLKEEVFVSIQTNVENNGSKSVVDLCSSDSHYHFNYYV